MTPAAKKLLSSIIVAASVAAAGCDVFAPGLREFIIQIDSIRAPSAVSGDTAFQLFFYGPVGPNGCHRFKAFRMTRSSTDADVTVLGSSVTGTCTAAPLYLDGEPLAIAPPVSDPFTLRVHQPNGAVLTRTIRAESR